MGRISHTGTLANHGCRGRELKLHALASAIYLFLGGRVFLKCYETVALEE